MKQRFVLRKRAACAVFALMFLLLSGCSLAENAIRNFMDMELETAAPEELPGEPEPTDAPAAETEAPELLTADPAAAEAALAAALSYKDVFITATGEQDFSADGRRRIRETLTELGYAVTDLEKSTPLANGTAARDFLSGACDSAVIYEICQDGGFIRHQLERTDGACFITMTRLAWNGAEPEVTYSNKYVLTALRQENGELVYEYDMPDNPPGTWHDGHIDTIESLRLD